MVELTGRIERITFTNEENGYTVARVSLEGSADIATVVGILHDPAPGTMLRMRGEWATHPKFGAQFKLQEYETVTPKTADTIERYLAAGAVKGIGPATAKMIVRKFGAESLEVMDQEIGRLREIPGIGRKRLAQITRAWEGQKAVREVMLFLQGNGVSPAYAARIYRRYGAGSVAVVKKNPYRLASDIAGIGFTTADRIAEALGTPRDGEERAEAGLLYLLDRCSDEGHLYLPRGELLRRGGELLDIEEVTLRRVLDRLEKGRRVVADRPVSDPETPVYPTRLFECELLVSRRLAQLASRAAAPAPRAPANQPDGAGRSAPDTRPAVSLLSGGAEIPPEGAEKILEPLSLHLGADQKEAMRTAFSSGVTVITGGPGTGKTTVIDVLARAFTAAGLGVLLAAPTGRAAKRMAETTGREAKTIHRMLEVASGGGGFRRNHSNPLDCEALILDEISMVDVPLMAALLDAIPSHARLVMVGDVDQLPSVGPGNLLADIITSGTIPVVRLTEVYRQESGSRIVAGAYDIIHGRIPSFATGEEGDFYFIEQSDPERVVALVSALVRERIPARFHLDPMDDVQVLTPMNRGAAGTARLNETLQAVLNPGSIEISRRARAFRAGDKVMQTRNNYDLDVFNGDIGRVKRVDNEAGELVVTFDAVDVPYASEEIDELTLAYAVTVHKSQGSEFPAVVIPLLTEHYLLLQRNLIYTAVTRGKRLVVIVGSRKALSMAVRNDRTQQRNSGLAERLRAQLINPPHDTLTQF